MVWYTGGDWITGFAVIYTSEEIENLGIGVTTQIDGWSGRREILWNDMVMIGEDGLRKGAKDNTHGSFPGLNKYYVNEGNVLSMILLVKEYLKVSEGIYMIVFGIDGDIYDENFREFSEMETVIMDVNDIIETNPPTFASREEIIFKGYTIFKFIDSNKR